MAENHSVMTVTQSDPAIQRSAPRTIRVDLPHIDSQRDLLAGPAIMRSALGLTGSREIIPGHYYSTEVIVLRADNPTAMIPFAVDASKVGPENSFRKLVKELLRVGSRPMPSPEAQAVRSIKLIPGALDRSREETSLLEPPSAFQVRFKLNHLHGKAGEGALHYDETGMLTSFSTTFAGAAERSMPIKLMPQTQFESQLDHARRTLEDLYIKLDGFKRDSRSRAKLDLPYNLTVEKAFYRPAADNSAGAVLAVFRSSDRSENYRLLASIDLKTGQVGLKAASVNESVDGVNRIDFQVKENVSASFAYPSSSPLSQRHRDILPVMAVRSTSRKEGKPVTSLELHGYTQLF